MLKNSRRERSERQTGTNERRGDLPCGRRGCTSGRVGKVPSSAAFSVEMKREKDAKRRKSTGGTDASQTQSDAFTFSTSLLCSLGAGGPAAVVRSLAGS